MRTSQKTAKINNDNDNNNNENDNAQEIIIEVIDEGQVDAQSASTVTTNFTCRSAE